MRRSLEDLASEVLEMNVESRAALAKRQLDNLDELTPEENERLWAQEAGRRYKQLRAGTATSIPSEEVFARLDARSRNEARVSRGSRRITWSLLCGR
jgi:hypothetical protein